MMRIGIATAGAINAIDVTNLVDRIRTQDKDPFIRRVVDRGIVGVGQFVNQCQIIITIRSSGCRGGGCRRIQRGCDIRGW